MDLASVDRWFAAYLEAFAAVARGDHDVARLMDWYAVPLTITVDAGTLVMLTAEDMLKVVGRQVQQLRTERFTGSVETLRESTLLNSSSAIRREGLKRRRADGTDIDQVDITYVIVATHDGCRIAFMAVRNVVPTG